MTESLSQRVQAVLEDKGANSASGLYNVFPFMFAHDSANHCTYFPIFLAIGLISEKINPKKHFSFFLRLLQLNKLEKLKVWCIINCITRHLLSQLRASSLIFNALRAASFPFNDDGEIYQS